MRWSRPSGSSIVSACRRRVPLQELALDTDLADIFNISRKRRKGVRPAA